jgi:hypothetical protein
MKESNNDFTCPICKFKKDVNLIILLLSNKIRHIIKAIIRNT